MLLSGYYIEDGEPITEDEFQSAFDEVATARNARFEELAPGYFEVWHLFDDEVDELIMGDYADTNGDPFTINFVPEP